MQLHQIVFFATQTLVSIYSGRRGGLPERLVTAALGLATIVSIARPATQRHGYQTVEWWLVFVDAVLLIALIAIALWSNRYWPMWVAALQLDTIALHGVRAFDPTIWALIYSRLVGLPAYPIFTLLVIGTIRHQRRVMANGPEADWVKRPYDGA